MSSALLGDKSVFSLIHPLSTSCSFQTRIYFSSPSGAEGLSLFLPSDTSVKSASSLNGVKDKRVCCLLPSILRFLFHKENREKHWAEYHSFCAVLLSVLTVCICLLSFSSVFEIISCCFGCSLLIIFCGREYNVSMLNMLLF